MIPVKTCTCCGKPNPTRYSDCDDCYSKLKKEIEFSKKWHRDQEIKNRKTMVKIDNV
jgi:hypothetical protein